VQINVRENVFACVSAFVIKTSSNLFSGWSHTIIESCVIKFVLNKYMCAYVVAIGYVFYV